MIVLLSCSINCLGNNEQLFYGAGNDSVTIAYDNLRIVNSKLIELEYEKDINKKLKEVIANDSVLIATYNNNTNVLRRTNRRIVKQRNILGGVSVGSIIAIILMLIK